MNLRIIKQYIAQQSIPLFTYFMGDRQKCLLTWWSATLSLCTMLTTTVKESRQRYKEVRDRLIEEKTKRIGDINKKIQRFRLRERRFCSH